MISDICRNPDDLPPGLGFLAGGGAATQLILDRDWTGHPLGPPVQWPTAFKAALSLMLNSPESMILCWDADELHFFFNETYFPLLGPRLVWAMGARFDQVWADALEQAMPIVRDAFAGDSRHFDDLPWKLDTDRGAADTWFSFSYSRVLDADGAVAGLFIFTNETTARVLADRALAASQDELRALNAGLEREVAERTADRNRLWELSTDLMLVAALDGTIEAVNRAWTRILGWEEHELVGRPLFDFIHPDDLAHTQGGAAGIGEGDTLVRFENRYRHIDGSYRDIVWGAGPGGGKIVAAGRDETEAKARARALAEAENQLRQAQKMEAVGQLTGGLAHDFNNLLTGMMGNLELLQLRLTQGRLDDLERFILAAQGAGRRAASLTQRLLAFSRRQTLDPKPTDVNRLIAGIEDLLRRTVGPAVAIEVVGAAGLWVANIDAGQLENAVLNLCINARDAMPDGGRLTIETANRWLDDRAAGERDLPPGEYLAISVSDTGTGMSGETIERAFEPFFTTKPMGEGTGLGLSMIYGFARQSHGQVRIYSEVGVGTTVSIYLPRHDGDPVRSEDAPGAAAVAAKGAATVLVVDDEASIRQLIDEVLSEQGYTVVGAADGAAGIKVLESGAPISLLITDVGLPNGMNGRQVADAARLLRPDLRVLFITGYAENAAVGNGHLDAGMELLTKPFAMRDLAHKVAEMMRETTAGS